MAGLNIFFHFLAESESIHFRHVNVGQDQVRTEGLEQLLELLKVFEGSKSELDLREFKYLVPGLGTVRADDLLSAARDNPELVIERPAGL